MSDPVPTSSESDQGSRARQLFAQALAQPSVEQRHRFLGEACGADHQMRSLLLSLLEAHEQMGAFLERDVTSDPDAAPATQTLGESIGPYKLVLQLGEGGCGVVYMAEQEEPVHRRVALKVIKLGMDTKHVIARFEAERQALALMEHPHIARVLDAGATESGRPYFVMELVRGVKITEFCDENQLSTPQRLELFIQVCRAVQHAHQKGIIHRDLKPSNILVTRIDGAPVPKVIDFGIAKAIEGRLTDQTLFTALDQFIGTPAYMSPEQAVLTNQDVDTRSDIYSLGVLLYELLTGRTPFESKELLASGLDNLRRTIREKEPIRPSTRLRSLAPDELSAAAQCRRLEALKLIHLMRGDLDAIVGKCLEKMPGARYQSALDLADELGRYLQGEPIIARPVGTIVRVGRWCRRKPALATLGAAVLALVLAIIVGAPIAISQINRARIDAERARAQAERSAADLERNLYAADMRLASEELRDGAMAQLADLLNSHKARSGGEDLRGFEWRYLRNASQKSARMTRSLLGLTGSKIVIDPHLVLTGSTLYHFQEETDQVLAWDTRTWTPLPLEVPPTGASGRWWLYPAQQAALELNDQSHTITVHRLPGFEGLTTFSLPGRPFRAALSGDLAHLAVAFQDGDAQGLLLRDVAANSERRIFDQFRGKVIHLSFSPDSHVLVGACQGGEIGLWSVAEGKALPAPGRDSANAEQDWPQPPFFGPGASRLYLTPGRELNALKAWDWTRSEMLDVYQAPLGRLKAFAFSPDGSILAAADSSGVIALLETKELRQIGALPVRGVPVSRMAFSPSGNLLAAGGVDRSTTLWDVKTQRELQTLGGDDNTVLEVLFTSDESLLTRMGDGHIKIWDLRAVMDAGLLWRTTNRVEGFIISPDERAIATKDNLGKIHVWDRVSGAHLQSISTGEPNSTALLFDMSFSPTAPSVAWSGCFSFGLLDYQSGQSDSFSLPRPGGFCNPVFSLDGRELAVAGATNILILDVATRTFQPFAPLANTVFGLAYSPDGKSLASVHNDGALILWDRSTGRQIANVPAHNTGAFNVAFSPDGQLLATSGLDKMGKLWDVTPQGLKLRLTLSGFVGREGLVFSPDGRRIAAALSGADFLELWDTNTGLEVGAIYGRRGAFSGFAFSRDGNSIYSGAEDGEVRIWQAPPLDSP